MRGRKRKPDELKALTGSRTLTATQLKAAKKEGTLPVTTAVGIPECPPWLDELAKAFWGRAVSEFAPTLHPEDGPNLALLCQTWSNIVRWTQIVRDEGEVSRGEPHKLIRQIHQAMLLFNKLASDFGWSPASRSRLTVPGDKTPASETDKDFFVDPSGPPLRLAQ